MNRQQMTDYYDAADREFLSRIEPRRNMNSIKYLEHCSLDEQEASREKQVEDLKESLREIRRNEAFLRAEGEEVETYFLPGVIVVPPTPQHATQP